ncbi:MAG: hypothetical protein ACFFD6_06735, partial [Candidatus Thorarchaeota archaeon]
EEPQDAFWEFGYTFAMELDVWDYSTELTSLTWWMNDTVHFYWEVPSFWGNMTTISLGEYGLEIRVSDNAGNYVSAEITVTVRDSIKPVFTFAPDEEMRMTVGTGSTEYFIFQAEDINPASYQILYNGAAIRTGLWNSSLDEITLAVDVSELAVGTHTWTVIATDIVGNSETQTLTIIVEPESTPTTTTTPPPLPIPMEVIAIAVAGVVVILLIILVVKRRF